MGILERAQHMETRKNYLNVWQTSLIDAMNNDCKYWCFASCCPPCVSYMLRKRALRNEMSRYQCCGGYMPCSGKIKEKECPELCLCLEVSCCFNNSVASTRFLLQDEFNIQTTQCDNCLIAFMIILGQIACICRCIACLSGNEELKDIAEILTLISDLVHCTVCACMQTQHKVELDYRHGINGSCPSDLMMVPAIQSMSRFDKSVPPSVGQPVGLVPLPQQPPPPQYAPYPPEQQQYAPYPPGPPPQYAPYPPPQQGQWQQQPPPPPYGYAYPPQYVPVYPPNASPPQGYAPAGHPLPPPGYYPPGNPPPPQHFASDEHPLHPPSPPPPPAPKTKEDSK